MGVAAPLARHPQVEDLGDRLVVTLRPPRSWVVVLFLTAWLIGWSFGGIDAIRHLGKGGAAIVLLFLAVWLIGWFVGGCFAFLALAWLLRGREVLTVTPNELQVVRSVGRIALTRRYDAALVEGISAGERGGQGYCVRISYRGADVDFANGISKREAEEIAAAAYACIRPRSWWDESEDVPVSSVRS